MKLLLVNSENIISSVHPDYADKIEMITNKELLSNTLTDYIGKFEEIFMFFNKSNIDFYSLAAFIRLNDKYVHHFTVVIDASDFTEDDNDTLDAVIETLSDHVKCLIADDITDLKKMVMGLISKYL